MKVLLRGQAGVALMAATSAMTFIPRPSILFLGARVRALQMDPVNGDPQARAQTCAYMRANAVMFQLILSVAGPAGMGGSVKKGSTEGDMEYAVQTKTLGMCLTAGRYIVMLSIYIRFAVSARCRPSSSWAPGCAPCR